MPPFLNSKEMPTMPYIGYLASWLRRVGKISLRVGDDHALYSWSRADTKVISSSCNNMKFTVGRHVSANNHCRFSFTMGAVNTTMGTNIWAWHGFCWKSCVPLFGQVRPLYNCLIFFVRNENMFQTPTPTMAATIMNGYCSIIHTAPNSATNGNTIMAITTGFCSRNH